MAVEERTKMVNGRVSEQAAEKAGRILLREGLTVSSFIRNSLEYIAREGTVPASGKPAPHRPLAADRIKELVHAIESRSMPGKRDFPGLEGDALVERIRMEHHGY